jgi:colanic acid/amylovoran biosynthesis protein
LDVLLLNAVTLNGGDGAIMLAIREHVRRALGDDAELVVADPRADTAAGLYPGVRFTLPAFALGGRLPARWLLAARRPWTARWLLREGQRRKLAEYARADLAISTGGTYLVENYDLRPRMFELRLALALGLPLVLYTQSLGPFRQRRHRRAFRRIFSAAQVVMVRDERSRQHVLELGVPPERVQLLADAVFTYARPASAEPASAPRRVAISVREWAHYRTPDGAQRYERAIRELVTHLVAGGAEITFLSTCQGVPDYWTDDSAYAAGLVAGLPEPVRARVTVDRSFHRPEALLDRLAGFDAIVSTRMHLAILGVCAGTPVLPIAYEFKTRELFRRLGLERHVRDIDDVDGAALVEAFERFWTERDQWRAALVAGVKRERELADRAIELVAGAAPRPRRGSALIAVAG